MTGRCSHFACVCVCVCAFIVVSNTQTEELYLRQLMNLNKLRSIIILSLKKPEHRSSLLIRFAERQSAFHDPEKVRRNGRQQVVLRVHPVVHQGKSIPDDDRFGYKYHLRAVLRETNGNERA